MVITVAIFFGLPALTFPQIITFLILTVQGVILNIILYQSFALTAFWIENPDPVYWIFTKMAWFVNGTFVPLALLPIAFRTAADLLPLSAPYFSGRIFEMSTDQQLLKYILIQSFWLIILGFTVHILYKKGIKRVSINGG
jgi:ABC-2 type transport system permease protein